MSFIQRIKEFRTNKIRHQYTYVRILLKKKNPLLKTQISVSVLCVGSAFNFHGEGGKDGYWGVYRVSDKWWCGIKQAKGICNVKCSDLITDMKKNAECGRKVFRKSGIDAWSLENDCLDVEEEDGLNVCIDENDGVGIGLDVRAQF